MKRIILLVFSLLCVSFCPAQSINGQASTLRNYDSKENNFIPLENGPDYFTAFMAPKLVAKKNRTLRLAIYYKNTQNMTFNTITMGDCYLPISVFPAGEKNFGVFWDYKKKEGYIIKTADLPLTAAGTVHPTDRLAIPSKERLKCHTAQSANGTKHAVLMIASPKKVLPVCHVLIYDQFGNERAYRAFTPQISGTQYQFQDMTISDDGEVTILLRSEVKKGKETRDGSMHVAVMSKDGDVSEYRIPAPTFGEIHSAKMILLKNGKHFIGGYYGETTSKPSTGYFSYVFDPKAEDIVDEHHYELPSEQSAKNQIMVVMNFKYKICAHDIFELDNGKIVMLGEHRASCWVSERVGNMVTTYYINRASDIVYQTFDDSGESNDSQMIRKLQQATSGLIPQETMACNTSYTFEDLGISYYAFQKGNDIYLMYNNNAEDPDADSSISALEYKRTGVRFTKISEDGTVDKKLVMKSDLKKTFFQTVWMVDDDNVYFGTFGKPGYLIESMSIK